MRVWKTKVGHLQNLRDVLGVERTTSPYRACRLCPYQGVMPEPFPYVLPGSSTLSHRRNYCTLPRRSQCETGFVFVAEDLYLKALLMGYQPPEGVHYEQQVGDIQAHVRSETGQA